MKLAVLSMLAAVVAAVPATAQITTVGPFTGQVQEGFEAPMVLFLPCMPSGVFGGSVQMCTTNGSGACHTTGGWSFQCQIGPHGGTWLFGSAGPGIEITFPNLAYRFGGYFGSHSGFPDATFDFYDANNVLIGTQQTASIPADCTWNWHGFELCGGFKKVVITGLNPYGGGFVLMDDLEADLTPTCNTGPSAYCTAGTSSNGCVPAISASAHPSVSQANACSISVANVEGQKSGLIFYGIDNTGFTAVPWATGSNSFLCVKPPTQRMSIQGSGGTNGACDGTLVQDFNAFLTAFPAALGQPFAVGNDVYAQAWYRDPPAPKTTNLTDAVEMTFVP